MNLPPEVVPGAKIRSSDWNAMLLAMKQFQQLYNQFDLVLNDNQNYLESFKILQAGVNKTSIRGDIVEISTPTIGPIDPKMWLTSPEVNFRTSKITVGGTKPFKFLEFDYNNAPVSTGISSNLYTAFVAANIHQEIFTNNNLDTISYKLDLISSNGKWMIAPQNCSGTVRVGFIKNALVEELDIPGSGTSTGGSNGSGSNA